jgi:2-(1,2-epoxy-1,2-dihydrophenyl)acetyl-CoA isomerase
MSHIHTEHRGAVGVIRIDRPQRFNSMDVETARDFRKAALGLARDDAVGAVVLRGAPGTFCSGADLKYVREGGASGDLGYLRPEGHAEHSGYGSAFRQILEYLHSAISEIRRAPRPFIAAVDGVAAAGGFGLAMCCDLVFASERASFEWAYGKTGLTGAESSTFLLPRLVGFRTAMNLMLRNPRLDAQAALTAGLVNEVLPVAGFDDAVLAVAEELASGPTHAFGVAKGLLNRAAGLDRLDAHLDQELDQLARVADGPEFSDGLSDFFERRSAGTGAG